MLTVLFYVFWQRVSRLFTGFRKLSLDDITKSHVIHDIQQYILYRLDSDDNLRKHLNKDTAEILDKLHVKCNGCLLYIELVGFVFDFMFCETLGIVTGIGICI